jgi:hypothetical protein
MEVLEMADFGICENPVCELSYHSPILAVLRERIEAIHRMERRNAEFSHILEYLKPFKVFFQFRAECLKCGQFLYRVIQPTADLRENPKSMSGVHN